MPPQNGPRNASKFRRNGRSSFTYKYKRQGRSNNNPQSNESTSGIDRRELQRIYEECRRTGLDEEKTKLIVKKWKRSEIRRLNRIEERQNQKVCFGCRQPGHNIADCPSKDDSAAIGVCFKCGSCEHSVADCKSKAKGYPYATCFVCHEMGHLSKDCKQNENGVYPDGGSCRECGKCDHLIKDCPALDKKIKESDKMVKVHARSENALESVDFEDTLAAQEDENNATENVPVKKKLKKVVKF